MRINKKQLGNTDRIEDRLDKAQKNKVFKDVGKRVRMSKKELAALKSGVSVADWLRESKDNPILAESMLKKDTLWPKPDFLADAEEYGLRKAVFKSLFWRLLPVAKYKKQTIVNLDPGLHFFFFITLIREYWEEFYVEDATHFHDLFRTFNELATRPPKFFSDHAEYLGHRERLTGSLEYYALRRSFGKTDFFLMAVVGSYDPWKARKTQAYNLYANSFRQLLADIEKTDNIEGQIALAVEYFKKPGGKQTQNKSRSGGQGQEPDGQDQEGEEDPEARNPIVLRIRKNGIDVQSMVEDAEDIVDTFGFKTVQFGNYMTDKESAQHVWAFLGAIQDLLDVADLAPGVNEGLSIAFGARGRGGKNAPAAHYEPALNIINLTKRNGQGTVAHEWAHFLDFKIGKLVDNKTPATLTSPRSMDDSNPELKNAISSFRGFINKALNGFEPKNRQFVFYAKDAGFYQVYGDNQEEIENWIYNSKYRHYLTTSSLLNPKNKKFYSYLARHLKLDKITIQSRDSTNRAAFLLASEALDRANKKDYWASYVEVFARCFETYIFEKLKGRYMENNYLVSSANGFQHPVYPQGEEREAMNAEIDKIMIAIKPFLKPAKPKKKAGSEKRVNETVSYDEAGKTLTGTIRPAPSRRRVALAKIKASEILTIK